MAMQIAQRAVATLGPRSWLPPLAPRHSRQRHHSRRGESTTLLRNSSSPSIRRLSNGEVTNTTKNGKLRGQVIPYANPRAYTDRLNALFTPAGWTRKYTVQTSPNFERSKDQEDGREGVRYLRTDHLRPRYALGDGGGMSRRRQCRYKCRSAGVQARLHRALGWADIFNY